MATYNYADNYNGQSVGTQETVERLCYKNIKKYYDCEILYLWETDIKTDINLCLKLIDLYINNNGKLKDYNSFNYHLQNDKLVLNNNIINPFFITQNPYRLQGFVGNDIAEVVHL